MSAKPERKSDPFSAEVDARIREVVGAGDEKATLVRIAADAGCSVAELYQWRNGIRPVPPKRAVALAHALDSQPELLSKGYSDRLAPAANVDADEIQSLRLAVSLLSSVMAIHRPVEAKEAAKSLRRNVERRLMAKSSFLHELARTLDGDAVDQ